jgi:hypothetical protein
VDRQTWLALRTAAVVAAFDAEAATYDDNPYPADAQREWVAPLLAVSAGWCWTGRAGPGGTSG